MPIIHVRRWVRPPPHRKATAVHGNSAEGQGAAVAEGGAAVAPMLQPAAAAPPDAPVGADSAAAQTRRRILRKRPGPSSPGLPLRRAAPASGADCLFAGGAAAPRDAAPRFTSAHTKRSGVRGVSWDKAGGWKVQWGPRLTRTGKIFPVRRYMDPGKTREGAEVDALRAAIAFHEELVRQGKARAAKVEHAEHVRGVSWNKRSKAWQVRITLHGTDRFGGYFRPGDATPGAIELARLAAVERRRELELRYYQVETCEAPPPGRLAERDGGSGGAGQASREGEQHVQSPLSGGRAAWSLRPRDGTPEEIKWAHL
mmetsp:Transcript_104248/g.290398  ORF Transcript_104248/g.290398 Transcript_104248/m.290398 type:complete len:313 (-) Transcript_104248:130-1068(-)